MAGAVGVLGVDPKVMGGGEEEELKLDPKMDLVEPKAVEFVEEPKADPKPVVEVEEAAVAKVVEVEAKVDPKPVPVLERAAANGLVLEGDDNCTAPNGLVVSFFSSSSFLSSAGSSFVSGMVARGLRALMIRRFFNTSSLAFLNPVPGLVEDSSSPSSSSPSSFVI